MRKAVLIFSIIIVLKQFSQPANCNFETVRQAIAPRIFAEQTTDGKTQSVVITRFLHNKAGIIGSEVGKCYFSYIDPIFLVNTLSIFGFFSFLYFIYDLTLNRAQLTAVLVLFPFIAFYSFPSIILIIIYKLFAIIGLTLFALKK